MPRQITIHDKTFRLYIENEIIATHVSRIAEALNSDYEKEVPVFLVVLNGAFMFASDLLKQIQVQCEVSFIKLASYRGTSSTGAVTELVGLTEELKGRSVVIVEDIVDSGLTLEMLITALEKKNVRNIRVATAFFKPGTYTRPYPVDYYAFSIPNEFVIGYGMDYQGLGRNLKDIYLLE
jgi:hypoxanthine phosphoribosyltransferase